MGGHVGGLRLGKRRQAALRVLITLSDPATFDKVRCRGVALREWRVYSALGEDLRLLAEAGYVAITPPTVRGGIHIKPRLFELTADGRAKAAALVQGQEHAPGGER